jgi:hypothetical protein
MNPSVPNPATGRAAKAIFDLAIGIAGTVHVGMVLFGNLYSPLFGVVLILLAGYRLLQPRNSKRGRYEVGPERHLAGTGIVRGSR